ncbi:DNA-binding response regulator [Drancourtella sp. An12]|uniref:response regulator transcription factor n=1 Tax=Drancourtella sp. An12 TaxID=1965548 RepID=UPI000B3AA96D|nr:response regulator transcription factor [Drancourtella sp. An12]OUQ47166.1 DNA-binding response regulator [Drancourtella sp. An12]
MKYRILLVEDDEMMVEILKRNLEKWGYLARGITDFQNVMDEFQSFEPQLVLMDISLPFYNGYYWCGEIRKVSQVPVIFLSSSGDDMNLVMAIQLGADDFVAKPFRMDVLTAKIQAVLRRAYTFGVSSTEVLAHKGVTLNLDSQILAFGDQKLELGKNEFGILRTLLEHPGKIIERTELIRNLWETESYIDDNTLTVNVTRLRRRLEEIGLKDYILTKKGVGYYVEE